MIQPRFICFRRFSPDNQRVIYLRVWRSNPSRAGVYLADLRRAPDQQRDERLLATNFGAELATSPDGSGRLAFLREGALMVATFDVERGDFTGEPFESPGTLARFATVRTFTCRRPRWCIAPSPRSRN